MRKTSNVKPKTHYVLRITRHGLVSTTRICSSGWAGGKVKISVSPRSGGSGTPRSNEVDWPARNVVPPLPTVAYITPRLSRKEKAPGGMATGASVLLAILPRTWMRSPTRLTSPTSTRTRGPLATGVSAGMASPPARRSRRLVTARCTAGGRFGKLTCGSWYGCTGGAFGSVGRGAKRWISAAVQPLIVCVLRHGLFGYGYHHSVGKV